MIKIIIADDDLIVIEGVKSLLATDRLMKVVGVAVNGRELIEILSQKGADIALLDISMPTMDGIEAASIVREKFPETKVIMLTMHKTRNMVTAALEVGAMGYLMKNTSKEELINAIREVHAGNTFYCPQVTETIMSGIANRQSSKSSEEILTKREVDVIRLIVAGLKSKEIADKLFIETSTVETHRKNIMSKLNVKNVAGLIKYANENNI
jgi:two-component system, NarL family, nitrate/nitrite response regulator NarL